MSQPKFIYFNIRAKGELIRLIAAAGGYSLADERVPFSEWQKLKPDTPFGQVPVLQVGDKKYAQRLAIAFYVARKCGLYPTGGTDEDKFQTDMALLYTDELLENLLEGFRDKKFRNNLETLEKVKKETLPAKLPKLEAMLKENGTGFFVGNKLSLVDISAFDVLEHVVDILGASFLDAYPLLKASFKKVGDLPGIKKLVSSRPKPEEGFDF